MYPIATTARGSCLAFPDVCLVPSSSGPVPTPFSNTGSLPDCLETIAEIRIEDSPVVVESSVIPRSTGDEQGTAGGVVSGTFCGPVRFKTASSKVYARNKRVVLHGAVTSHNADNAVGQIIEPSQAKVMCRS